MDRLRVTISFSAFISLRCSGAQRRSCGILPQAARVTPISVWHVDPRPRARTRA
jgi:hypothetical protein